jgi:hypothetical protein
MSIEFPEPKTEDEAQRIKRFLEAGGEMAVKEIESFRADGSAAATLGQPGALKFGASAAQVMRSVGALGNRRAILTIDVSDLKPADQFSAAVFLNNPEASLRTSSQDPAFAGTFGFFFHSSEHVGPSDRVDADTLQYQLDITDSMQRVPRSGDPLTVHLVLLPGPKAPAAAAGVTIRSVAIKVLESTVKRST